MSIENNKVMRLKDGKILYDDLRDRVEEKLDAPDTAGTSGQVLTSDGQGGQAWANPPACDISDVQMNGTSVVSNGVANIPVATDSTLGVLAPNGTSLKIVAGGILGLSGANSSKIKNGTDSAYPIMPNKEHEAAFYGLAKAAGVDLANETVTVGTYPETSKAAINNMIGSTSKANLENAGITGYTYTTKFGGEQTVTTATGDAYISPYYIITTNVQSLQKEYLHRVTFDGTEYILPCNSWSLKDSTTGEKDGRSFEYVGNLALFQSDVSGVPEGTYNVPFCVMVTYIGDSTTNRGVVLLTSTAGEHTFLVEQIANAQTKIPDALIYGNGYIPIKTFGNEGSSYNAFSIGINEIFGKRGAIALGFHNTLSNSFGKVLGDKNTVVSDGIAIGYHNDVDEGISIGKGNTVSENGIAVGIGNDVSSGFAFGYGLDVQSSIPVYGMYNNSIPTPIPNEWQSNTAYRIGDIVSVTPYPTAFRCKVEHTSGSLFTTDFSAGKWEVLINVSDTAVVIGSGADENSKRNGIVIKTNGDSYFCGNVYVNAGDDTSAGTRLATIDEINPVVTVSGSTPSITAESGTQYICGEVSTLAVTIPTTGCIDVVFESGSTATVLTVTPPTGQTIKWPAWFNPTSLSADTTYEINILNGTLGTVMAWA